MNKGRWLLLLHQIPPQPTYFRAKVLRRLSQVGALPVKNSAYLLPETEDTLEDFEWICEEIRQEQGAAWLFRAEILAGLTAEEIEEDFRNLRAPDYRELIEAVRTLLQTRLLSKEDALAVARLRRRRDELHRIDFFEPPERQELQELMLQLEADTRQTGPGSEALLDGPRPQGRTWVTRKGVKVDRIASAWLIRRLIDREASFRFVDPDKYTHSPAEIRFDMFGGEFTHRGDACTFEVLLRDFELTGDPALTAIGEMIHDIDLKQDRFQRPETAGLASMIEGLCRQTTDDHLRLDRGAVILDAFQESFHG